MNSPYDPSIKHRSTNHRIAELEAKVAAQAADIKKLNDAVSSLQEQINHIGLGVESICNDLYNLQVQINDIDTP